jgi:hypothetical protein
MSFRQFGGLQFASKHNAVASYYNTSSNLLVTQNVGQPNSYITFLSDISGNINIYGDLDVSGNINVSGDVDISGNLYVQGDVDISGNLHVQGNIDCSGNGSFDNSIYIYDVSSYSVISENGTNLNLVNYNANGYININPNGQTGITVNNSGQVGIKNANPQYSLDVTGNLRTTMDASINTLTVGLGGGNVSGNTVVGSGALYSNTTGQQNTVIGSGALQSNTTSSYNTAIGDKALYSNTTGILNNALGYQALYSNTTGDSNNAFGLGALLNSLGSNNSAFGGNAGIDCKTSGSTYNTFLGAFSTFDLSSNTYQKSTAIGYQAIINASNQIVLGTANESVKIPGSYVGIGGNYNPLSGFNLDVSGNLRTTSDSTINTLTVGKGSGNVSSNTAVGFEALQANTTAGSDNTAIGLTALKNNTTGDDNTAIGSLSLFSNTTGNRNTATGRQALLINTGSDNTSIGYYSLFNNTTGNSNTAIGESSGFNLSNSSNFNTFLGAQTNVSSNLLTYNYSTALGYNAIIDASNQIVLGGLNGVSYPSVKIPGTYVGIGGNYNPGNGYALDVNGNVYATTYNTPSDYRIKENITQLDGKFVVDNLNPVTYLNNKLDKQDIGLIAHELQEIYPELVNGEKDGEQLQSVNYLGLIPILIKEIQDLKKEIKLVKIELNELKNK